MRLFLVFVLLLSGCATFDPAARAAQQRQQQEQAEQNQRAYVANMINQCEALGFSRNDLSIRQCMLQLYQSNQQQQQANRANALNYLIANQPRQPTQTNCRNTFMGVQCNTR